jgi:hypothetical protein
MSKRFLNVLTMKGLRYLLVNNRHDADLMLQVRAEIQRRNLLDESTEEIPEPRALDGYERDR